MYRREEGGNQKGKKGERTKARKRLRKEQKANGSVYCRKKRRKTGSEERMKRERRRRGRKGTKVRDEGRRV